MKKQIARLMIFIMLFSIFPFNAFSYGETIAERIARSKEYTGVIDDPELLMNQADITINDIYNYLIATIPAESKNRIYKLNPYVYQKYKRIAYTSQKDIDNHLAGTSSGDLKTVTRKKSDNTTLTINEYRYLGYDWEELKENRIENGLFPADKKASNPMLKNWITNHENIGTWNDNIETGDINLENYILRQNVQDNGWTEFEYSFKDILEHRGAYTNDQMKNFIKVINAPSFSTRGQFRLQHRPSDGSLWYGVVYRNEFDFQVEGGVDIVKTYYKVPVGENTVDINYDLNAALKNLKVPNNNNTEIADDWYNYGKYFRFITLTSMDKEELLFNNEDLDFNTIPSLNRSLNTTIDVSDMRVGQKKDFTISGTIAFECSDGYDEAVSFSKIITVERVGDCSPDFFVYKGEDDVTDGTLTTDSLNFTTAESLILKDNTFSEDTIDYRLWYIYDYVEDKWKNLPGTQSLENVNIDITSVNKGRYVKDGRIDFKMTLRTSAPLLDESGELPSVFHSITYMEVVPPEDNGEPVAVIRGDADYDDAGDCYVVMAGKQIKVDGRKSYNTEGLEITDYNFTLFNGAYTIDSSKKTRTFYCLETGKYPVSLEVIDEMNGRDTDSTQVRITTPIFEPKITITGTKKENRRVSIKVENKNTLYGIPVNESTLNWTITPLDGQGDTVRIRGSASNTISGSNEIETLFKTKGRYKVKVSGYIRARDGSRSYYGEKEETFVIEEDLYPSADFSVSSIMVRDVDNNNVTAIRLLDNSRSLDSDIISERYWYYRYDTDNDGSFADESFVCFAGGNSIAITLPVSEVGKYCFDLYAVEQFGQETLAEFVTVDDRRAESTYWNGKTEAEKICEITNVGPVVDIEASVRRNINLMIYTDYSEAERILIENELTLLRKNLEEKKMSLTVKYLDGAKVVGTYDRLNIKYNQYARFPYYHVPYYNHPNDYESDSFYTVNETVNVWDDDLSAGAIQPAMKGTYAATIYPSPNYTIAAPYGGYGDDEYFGNIIKPDNDAAHWYGYSNIYYNGRYTENIPISDYNFGIHSGFWGIEMFKFLDQAILGDFEFAGVNQTEPRILKTIDPANLENSLEDSTDNNYLISICKSDKGKIGFSNELKDKIDSNNVIYRTTETGFSKSNPLNMKSISGAKELDGNLYFIADEDYYSYNKAVNKLIKITKGAYDGIKVEKRVSLEDQVLNSFTTTYNSIYESRVVIPSTDYANYPWSSSYKIYDFDNDYTKVDNILNNFGYTGGAKRLSQQIELNPTTDELVFFKRFVAKNQYYGDDYSRDRYYDIYTKYTTGQKYKGYKNTKDYRLFLAENGSLHVYNYKSNGLAYLKIYGANNMVYEATPYLDQNINIGTTNYMELAFVNASTGSNKITIGTKTGIVYEYDIDTRAYTRINLDVREILDSGAILLNDGVTCYYDGAYFPNSRYVFAGGNINFIPNYNNSYLYKSYYYYWITPANELYATIHYEISGNAPQIQTYKIADNVNKILLDRAAASGDRIPLAYEDLQGNLIDAEIGILHSTSDIYSFQLPSSNTKSFGNYLRSTVNDNPLKYLSIVNGKLYTLDLEKVGFYLSSINYEYIGTDYAALSGIDYTTLIGENEMIKLSPRNRVYQSLAEVINSVYLDNKDYFTSDKLYVLLGENFELATIYSDYESDPLYARNYSEIHADPNYFENSLGRDPSISENIIIPRLSFNYVGKYEIFPHVRDNPKDDDRFDNYRLWNKDETKVEIYVHRKPVAKLNYDITKSGGLYYVSLLDNGSYDLDHYSEWNKGITAKEFLYKKKEDSIWTEGSYFQINRGEVYDITFRVRDPEGVWSDYVKEEVSLDLPALTLSAVMESADPSNPLNDFTPNNNVILKNIKTISIVTSFYLQSEVNDSNGNRLSVQNYYHDLTADPLTWVDNVAKISWRDITLTIPASTDIVTVTLRAIPVTTTVSVQELKFYVQLKNNAPPVITNLSYSPSVLYEGDNLNVNISATDPDNDILTLNTYLKDQNGNKISSTEKNISLNSSNYNYNYSIDNLDPGQYGIFAKVTDPKGLSNKKEQLIYVNEINVFGEIEPAKTKAGYYVTLKGSTTGYCDKVIYKLLGGKDNGDTYNLIPADDTSSLLNNWIYKYKTDPFEPDGLIPMQIKAYRDEREILGDIIYLQIDGSIYEDRKAVTKR